MKSKLFLSCVLVLVVFVLISASSALTAPEGTNVGGPIISDTTWTVSGNPYFVIANVQVLTGITLTIQPGVMVKFNAGNLLQVDGTLIARGTSTTPITFTSNLPSPQRGDWGNIEFTDTSVGATFDGGGNYISGSILQYCTVEYGGSGNTVRGAIETNTASPFIDHCIVRNNSSTGIYGTGTVSSPIVIANNTVYGNSTSPYLSGGGIYADSSLVTGNTVSGNWAFGDFSAGGIQASHSKMTGNTVSGNSASGYYDTVGGIRASNSTLMGNTISENSASGRFYGAGGIEASNSTVTGNTITRCSTYGEGGGGIAASSSTVTTNTVSGNSSNYSGSSGGGIAASSSTVAGNTVSGNSTVGSGGGVFVSGSTVTGNTISGNSALSGGGIFGDSSTMMSNTIAANTVSVNGQGAGVYLLIEYDSYDFLYNTVVGNTTNGLTTNKIGGIGIDGGNGDPNVHYNNFYSNSPYDAVIISSKDISGTNNFWGTVATVDILAHVYDWYDDTSRGRLLYIPYLQDPDPNAPVPPPTNLRAEVLGNSVTLSWNPIPSFTTGYGYKIYYDSDSQRPPYDGTGLPQGDSPIDVGNATTYTLSGLGSATYYFAVTGYDTLGHESWYSNEVNSLRKVFLPLIRKN